MSDRNLDLLPPEKNGYPTPTSRLKKFGIIVLIVLAILFAYGQSILDQQQAQQTQPTETDHVSEDQEDDDDDEWLSDFEADWD